jgi:hypothetical protein
MTRETKLGLVVAGTFLALVGGVVTVRLRQADTPAPDAEVAANQPLEPPTPAAPPEPEKHENPVSAAAMAMADKNKMPAGNAPPVVVPETPAAVQPTMVTVPADPPAPAPMPMPPPMEEKKQEPASPPMEPKPMEVSPAPAPVVPEPMTPVTVPTPAPTPAAPDAPAPAPVVSPTTPAVPEPMAPAPAPAPVVAPIPDPPPPPPPSPPLNPPLNPPVADPAGSPKPAAEPHVPPPPLNPNVTNTAGPSVTVVPASGAAPAGATLEPPRGVAAPQAGRDPFTAPARPTAPPAPTRDSYLEEQHRWRPGDNFAAVSQQYYSTDKYAAALQKYNRDYPLATREMRQNPPAVNPGQVVWVPPARILERDYAADIGGLTPVAPVVPTSRPAVEAVPPPPGLANSGFGNPAGQLYRVRGPAGESLQEIARRTLNDGNQAPRLRGFNPTLSPDVRLPIPAGTVLRLPAEAKVDPADKP